MLGILFYACSFILSLSCLVYYLSRKKINKMQNSLFLWLIIAEVVNAACGVTSNYIEGYYMAEGFLFHVQYLTQMGLFMAHSCIAPAYAFYTMAVNGAAIKRSKNFFIGFFLPFALVELLFLTNPVTSYMFSYDSQANFLRGPVEYLAYTVGIAYMGIGVIYMVRYKEALTKPIRHAIWYFLGITVVGILLQYIFPEMKVELFAETLTTLGLMITVENEEEYTDVSVGSYNRNAFFRDNRRLLQTNHQYAVATIHLTNLRFYSRMFDVNDVNKICAMIVDWLRTVHKNTAVYHIDVNGFAIQFFYDTDTELDEVALAIEKRFGEGWIYNDMEFEFNTVVRLARIPKDFSTFEPIVELTENVGDAETKGVAIFRGSELSRITRVIDVESALHRAIENDGFQVYYQPIWSADEDRIRSAEALLRLTDPELGPIPPDEFIPVAEENGLITKIGKIVFEKVCRFISENSLDLLGIHYVEINLSIYQLLVGDAVEEFERIMKKYHVDSRMVNLEITETASVGHSKSMLDKLRELMDMGIRFSLDDYGTGYSNLEYIISTNFSNIKSDKGLLWDSDKNEKSRVLLEDTIRMIRRLGMNIIQEGVENEAQLNRVVDAGANYIQGYYFSKPVPEEQFLEYIKNFKGRDSLKEA